MRLLREVAPVPPLVTGRAAVKESEPRDAVVAKRLVVVAVPKYPVPLAVKFVVLAPPDIVKRPLVIVEEAFERNPFVKVVSPPIPKVPNVAVWEKRFVDDAVVEKRLVVVAFPPTAVVNVRLVVDAVTAPRVEV